VVAGLGRYGPYVRRGKTFANLATHDDMFTVDLAGALEAIAEKKKGGGRTVIKELGAHPESGADVRVLKGRYGPYVTDGSVNATIPKGTDPAEVDLDDAVELLADKAAKGGGRRKQSRKGGSKGSGKGRSSGKGGSKGSGKGGSKGKARSGSGS